jgi:hypothetical protein
MWKDSLQKKLIFLSRQFPGSPKHGDFSAGFPSWVTTLGLCTLQLGHSASIRTAQLLWLSPYPEYRLPLSVCDCTRSLGLFYVSPFSDFLIIYFIVWGGGWLSLLPYILEVQVSNLSQETGCLDNIFVVPLSLLVNAAEIVP